MSLVNRAPLKNHRKSAGKGVVRFITKTGAPLTYTGEGRPIGLGQGQPDTRRANKEVLGSDKGSFTGGKRISRQSVYGVNNSGKSGGWSGPRSRTT